MTFRAPLVVAFALLLAGCVSTASVGPLVPASGAGPVGTALAFGEPTIIDAVRAGGEPVIAVTPKGTLIVGAHPGLTHTRYPPSPNLLIPFAGQSYLWRSTDHGATWQSLGLPVVNAGPRGLGQGVGDPDLAIDARGRIYFTDLEGLAAASVSWSDDDGVTWLAGNDIASTYGPNDRQWLATHGTDVYFQSNYLGQGERVLRSTDGGITWTLLGPAHCRGDLVVREDGAILIGCGDAIDVSTDGGRTFKVRRPPGASTNALSLTEPALDAAGNAYLAWANASGVFVAGSPDLGVTWSKPVPLAPPVLPAGATSLWPWVVAGDAGRVGVAWYATEAPGGPRSARGDWHLYAAVVVDAMGTPSVSATRVTTTPILQGNVCQNGTTCQANVGATGDRRLGDLFEAAVDEEGRMVIAFTVAGAETIGHPAFARQASGPLLYLTPRAPPPH